MFFNLKEEMDVIMLNDVEVSVLSEVCSGGVLVWAAELGAEASEEIIEKWWKDTFGNNQGAGHCVGD